MLAFERAAPPSQDCLGESGVLYHMSFLIPVLVIMLCTFCCFPACAGLDRSELRYAAASYALHVACGFVQWALSEFYYGISDAYGYIDDGALVARALSSDFVRFGPEVLKYACHGDYHLPFQPYWEGASGTMSAVTGVIVLFVGPSLLPCCLVAGWLAWFGAVCLYRAARDEVGVGSRPALIGIFFVPSVLYWCGGLTKETVVMGAFGVLALSTYRV